ncbi:MAG: M48 family metallopeptidase [Clostridiales bacterium]|jgi:predicted metal-dependent hydrolase|nr:M48 family metallopeptidase [Clostridiales bacterium]
MEYKLTRTKRKTIGIYVRKDAVVEVRCPVTMSKRAIDEFVASQRKWIEEQIQAIRQRNEKKSAFSVQIGCSLRLMGEVYPLAQAQGNSIGFDGEKFYAPASLSSQKIKEGIISIYKKQARTCIEYKVNRFAQLMGVEPQCVKINSASTRWGSCSGKNSLNFSWLLIMAQEKCIDYVIVHELAHILEHNHSKEFWSIVEGIIPDRKKQEKMLRELHRELANEDWTC